MQEGDPCCGGSSTGQSEKKPTLLENAEDQVFTIEKSYYMIRFNESDLFMQKVGLAGLFSFCVFLFASYYTFGLWPVKYKAMTFYGMFYGSGPLALFGLYKGGPKRLVAALFILAVSGYIAFYATQLEGDWPSKIKESFSMVKDYGYMAMTGELPPGMSMPKKKKKKGKKKKQQK